MNTKTLGQRIEEHAATHPDRTWLRERHGDQFTEYSWQQALDEIAAKTAISDHHPDAREGVTAFHEKRDARFNAWLEDGQS